ncbi:MAG: DUF4198 domain-containing protein [Verrucomicrobia bacterium]|nr:DUF4198 domain-containing protein [Verrucomicrobiota bacterium]
MKAIVLLGITLFIMGVTSPVGAHDLVLLPTGKDGLLIRFGHPGEYEPADLPRLVKLDAYTEDADKAISLLELKPAKMGLDWLEERIGQLIDGEPPMMVTGQYDNGYWISVKPEKYFNTSRAILPEGKDAGHYLKFAKGLFPAIGEKFNRVAGQQLEIIPQNDPFKLKPGEKLAVKVLFGNKPLAGVGVEIGDGKTKIKEENIPRFQTDSSGIAELPISHGSLQLIAIDYKTPPTHPDLSDHDDYSASLVFVIPE